MSEKDSGIIGTRLLFCACLLFAAILLIGAVRLGADSKNRTKSDADYKACVSAAEFYLPMQAEKDQADYRSLTAEAPEISIRINCSELNRLSADGE